MVQEFTTDTFQQEVLESAIPVLVDFWSPTCPPCRKLGPVLEEVAIDAGGQFRVGKVNVFDEQNVAIRYRISAVPTILVFKAGEVIQTLIGYHDKRKLMEALQQALDLPIKPVAV